MDPRSSVHRLSLDTISLHVGQFAHIATIGLYGNLWTKPVDGRWCCGHGGGYDSCPSAFYIFAVGYCQGWQSWIVYVFSMPYLG